jgi:hypothetical protein
MTGTQRHLHTWEPHCFIDAFDELNLENWCGIRQACITQFSTFNNVADNLFMTDDEEGYVSARLTANGYLDQARVMCVQ